MGKRQDGSHGPEARMLLAASFKSNWCNDKLDKMVAKNIDNFSPYTKHEMRRQLIVVNDEFAATVDHYREIAESRVHSLDGGADCLRPKPP